MLLSFQAGQCWLLHRYYVGEFRVCIYIYTHISITGLVVFAVLVVGFPGLQTVRRQLYAAPPESQLNAAPSTPEKRSLHVWNCHYPILLSFDTISIYRKGSRFVFHFLFHLILHYWQLFRRCILWGNRPQPYRTLIQPLRNSTSGLKQPAT